MRIQLNVVGNRLHNMLDQAFFSITFGSRMPITNEARVERLGHWMKSALV